MSVAYDGVGKVTTRLPRLYAAWVTGPRFVAQGDGDALLGQADLTCGVFSVLDATILDRIAARALAGFEMRAPRKYLSSGFHLFVTESNIQGVPYEIPFAAGSGTAPYVMMCHADRVHFSVRGVGSAVTTSDWADPDPALPLDVGSLVDSPAPHDTPEWRGFINATLGSSAFPVGLRARQLPRTSFADLDARQWPITGTDPGPRRFRLEPDARWAKAGAIERRAVDGGTIDNEPFELARWTLMETPPGSNERSAADADRAVLMIDPFPSAKPPAPSLPDGTLLAVVQRFLPMLINQARFKLDALVAALKPEVSSRFLIAPRRFSRTADGKLQFEPHAIACGLMGGFGGFLSEAMRAHDYQLGRLNAYRFLKLHFGFPLDNKVIEPGYAGVRDPQRFSCNPATNVPAGEDARRFQMIPVMESVEQPEMPSWPRVSQREVDEFVRAAGARAMALTSKAPVRPQPGWRSRSGCATWWRISCAGR